MSDMAHSYEWHGWFMCVFRWIFLKYTWDIMQGDLSVLLVHPAPNPLSISCAKTWLCLMHTKTYTPTRTRTCTHTHTHTHTHICTHAYAHYIYTRIKSPPVAWFPRKIWRETIPPHPQTCSKKKRNPKKQRKETVSEIQQKQKGENTGINEYAYIHAQMYIHIKICVYVYAYMHIYSYLNTYIYICTEQCGHDPRSDTAHAKYERVKEGESVCVCVGDCERLWITCRWMSQTLNHMTLDHINMRLCQQNPINIFTKH